MVARLFAYLQVGTLRRQTLKRFMYAAHIPGGVVTLSCLMAILLVLRSARISLTQVGRWRLFQGRLMFFIPKTGRKLGYSGFLVSQGGLTCVGGGGSDCDVLLRKRDEKL